MTTNDTVTNAEEATRWWLSIDVDDVDRRIIGKYIKKVFQAWQQVAQPLVIVIRLIARGGGLKGRLNKKGAQAKGAIGGKDTDKHHTPSLPTRKSTRMPRPKIIYTPLSGPAAPRQAGRKQIQQPSKLLKQLAEEETAEPTKLCAGSELGEVGKDSHPEPKEAPRPSRVRKAPVKFSPSPIKQKQKQKQKVKEDAGKRAKAKQETEVVPPPQQDENNPEPVGMPTRKSQRVRKPINKLDL